MVYSKTYSVFNRSLWMIQINEFSWRLPVHGPVYQDFRPRRNDLIGRQMVVPDMLFFRWEIKIAHVRTEVELCSSLLFCEARISNTRQKSVQSHEKRKEERKVFENDLIGSLWLRRPRFLLFKKMSAVRKLTTFISLKMIIDGSRLFRWKRRRKLDQSVQEFGLLTLTHYMLLQKTKYM